MPRPFLELSLEQFAVLLQQFAWRRRITEVHVHHTFRPNHAEFASRPPIQSIEGMFRFHTQERKFSDIAQHITIDPRGTIWTGRDWNTAPASATGFNGNGTAGPFMFEMIGDFDRAEDGWIDPQRSTAIEVIARVQKLFGLAPDAFRFHNEMSSKTCPGSAIRKDEVREAVAEVHRRLATENAPDATARADADRLLRLISTGSRALSSVAVIDELPESDMTIRERQIVAGSRAPGAAGRDTGDGDLTPDDLARLRRHVINLRMGAFSAGGVFQTTQADVDELFGIHLPAFLAERQARDPNAALKLVLFAHGGLNDEIESLKNARNRIDFYLENGCYPVFFVWETGVKETLRDILGQFIGFGPGRDVDGRSRAAITDPVLEHLFRSAGFSMWASMKRSAEVSFLPRQGGTAFVDALAAFWKSHSHEMEIHAIGHSAGSIFLAHFIDLLCRQPCNPPIQVETLHFLAPAITVALFSELLMPLVGDRIARMTEYTMHKEFEQVDNVGPYRKSLLYLVSRSFEDESEMPLVGLEESLRGDPDMRDFFGLLRTSTARAEILFSVVEDGPSHSTISRRHGDFDNDRLTMSGVIRRILGVDDTTPIVEFPETVSRTLIEPAAAAPSPSPAPPAPTAPAAAPAIVTSAPADPGGRRRALCIGIDEYPAPNTLAGCVNDARDWAAVLGSLGFETSLMLNGQATFDAILGGLKDLVESSADGDVVVLQYAGHGTQVPDTSGDEMGGRDSALCPVDFDSGRFIIDDDVRVALAGLGGKQVNFTCFFDCCHSGTITRMVAPGRRSRSADVRVRGFFTTDEQKAAHRAFRRAYRQGTPPTRGPATMREVSFAACTDGQTAAELDGHGLFTSLALPILRSAGTTVTNADFHQRVFNAFGTRASEQTPGLDCADDSRPRLLLAPIGARVAAAPPVPGSAGGSDVAAILARLDAIDRRLARLEG